MSFLREAILAIIISTSLLGTVHSIVHNVSRLGGYQEVNFPLQSGEINGRMVIVDSRQVSGNSGQSRPYFQFDTLYNSVVKG